MNSSDTPSWSNHTSQCSGAAAGSVGRSSFLTEPLSFSRGSDSWGNCFASSSAWASLEYKPSSNFCSIGHFFFAEPPRHHNHFFDSNRAISFDRKRRRHVSAPHQDRETLQMGYSAGSGSDRCRGSFHYKQAFVQRVEVPHHFLNVLAQLRRLLSQYDDFRTEPEYTTHSTHCAPPSISLFRAMAATSSRRDSSPDSC